MEEDDLFIPFEKKHIKNKPADETEELRIQYQTHRERGFTCVQCGFPVTADRELSGVNNRNHCPRCLFSRHVDEFKAGDRKADCLSRMKPIGLTVKQTHKRYDKDALGELMLIHHCTGCGKVSINRIAADDDAALAYQIFTRSVELSVEEKLLLDSQGILLLGLSDLTAVYSQLFGWQAILEEFEPHRIQESVSLPIASETEFSSEKNQPGF